MSKLDFKWNGLEVMRQMRKAVDLALTDIAVEITQDAIQAAPVFTGNLRRSITFTRPYDRRGQRAVDVGVGGGKEGDFRYALAVEYGRQPGRRPPVDSLKLWVERKWGAGRVTGSSGSKTGRGSRRARGRDRDREIESAAFVLARHIGEHGTKPHPFLVPAWRKHIDKMHARLKARWAEVAGRAV